MQEGIELVANNTSLVTDIVDQEGFKGQAGKYNWNFADRIHYSHNILSSHAEMPSSAQGVGITTAEGSCEPCAIPVLAKWNLKGHTSTSCYRRTDSPTGN